MEKRVFVGREHELARLHERLDRALSGEGQVCFISGQAGTGKTALVHRFVEQAFDAHADLVMTMGTCNAQTGIGDPFLPFREALLILTDETAAQQSASKVSPQNTNRLQPVLVRSVQVLVEVAPELVGVFVPGATLVGALGRAVVKKVGWMDRLDELAKERASAAAMAEAVTDQSRIFEKYTAFLQELSEKTPLILFLDDLQWADKASLSLLFHLGRHLESSRIMILGAFRPDDVALGRDGERHPLESVVNELTRYYGDVTVDLDNVPEKVNRRFVEALLDTQPNCLAKEFRESLYHQTGGHALFTVELLQTMMDRGDLIRDADGCWIEGPSLDWNALPARVEGVIEERIDRLPHTQREMLQVASVQGEMFNAEVVARVQGMADREAIWEISRELQRRHRLVHSEGLLQLGRVRLSRYRFAHNLFQHYLYHSLADAEKAYLHQDVGQVLEAMFEGETEQIAAQLAHHFELAGMPAKAAAYRLQAGNRARRMSAHQEAATHLKRGLDLVADLPAGPKKMQLELNLQVSLGMVLIAIYGYASPQADQVFARARELCRRMGDPPQSIQVLLAQSVFHLMRGEPNLARQEADHVLHLAQQAKDIPFTLTSHLLLGAALMYMTDYDQARQHLEQVLALYDPVQHRDLAYQQGQDPGIRALAFLARVLWLQGYSEQATAKHDEALKLAEELDHPYSRTVAMMHAATMHAMLRQWPECQRQAEKTLDLARQGGFKMWQAQSAVLHGLALAHQDRTREGLQELTEGLFLWEASGAGLVAYGRTCLAEVYWLSARQEDGLRTLGEALYRSQEAWWQPEQYRLRAELLLLAPGAETEAEAHLRQAVDLATSQKARSLQLRALTSLARLLHRQGRASEGRALLAECYAWFAEGLDLPDLREARELLEELK